MQQLLSLSIALFAGLMLSRLAKKLQLPAVTAYLIAGILIGPFVLGRIGIPFLDIEALGFSSLEHVESFSLLSKLALGFIAFSIGNEFRISELKHIGKQAAVIGVFQAIVTTVIVDAALIALHFAIPDKLSISAAIVLGAIATATAPAATLMVVRQYKPKGALTSILLPVVALDDAVGLVVFAISFGVAEAISLNSLNLVAIIVDPLIEVFASLLLGALMGVLFTFCERFFHSRSKRLAMSVTFVMLTVAISMIELPHLKFSPLLTCMMLGTVFCNICDFSEELMDRVDRWTAPLFIMFFVLSGAELDFEVFGSLAVVLIGVVYIAARSAGKYSGAYLSAKSVKCDEHIVKYLGITLLPQAGVALGMAIEAAELGPEGHIVASITLFAVLVYEIVGPTLTKMALTKAGDIVPSGKTSAREAAKNSKT